MRILTLDDMPARQAVFYRWFAKDHELVQVYTSRDAIGALLGEPRYDVVFLDHDLSEAHYRGDTGPGTGMDVVDAILESDPEFRPFLVVVHSWNMMRAQEMVKRLRDGGVVARRWMFDPEWNPLE